MQRLSRGAASTIEGRSLRHGQIAFTRRLDWREVHGAAVFDRYGAYSGYEARPLVVVLAYAREPRRCDTCGEAMERGDLHGSSFYEHHCLNCCTPDERTAFSTTWPPAGHLSPSVE